jgi:hypothetical protein
MNLLSIFQNGGWLDFQFLALPQFLKSLRDENVATTQAGKFPKL